MTNPVLYGITNCDTVKRARAGTRENEYARTLDCAPARTRGPPRATTCKCGRAEPAAG